RVSQNHQTWRSIRGYDIIRVAWNEALSWGQGPRNRVKGAAQCCSGAGQSIEILWPCDSAALRVIDSNEHTSREVASGWSGVFPSNSSKFRRKWPENFDAFRCDDGSPGATESAGVRHHVLSGDAKGRSGIDLDDPACLPTLDEPREPSGTGS